MTPSTILPTPNQHSFTTPNAYLSEPDDDVNEERVADEMRVCASENELRERSERRPGVDLHDRHFGTDVERLRPHSVNRLNGALNGAQHAWTRASSVSASVNSRDGWPTPHESILLSVSSSTLVNRGNASSRPTYAQALGAQVVPSPVYTFPASVAGAEIDHASTFPGGTARRYGLPFTSSVVDPTSFPPLSNPVDSSFDSGPGGKLWLTLRATSPKGAPHLLDTSRDVPPASVEVVEDAIETSLPDPDFLTPSLHLPPTHASSPPISREKALVPIEKLPPHRTSSSDPAAISAGINGISSPAIISSTLPIDCISPRLASLAELQPEPLSPSSSSLVASPFTPADISGTVEAELTIGQDGVPERRRFFVVDMKGECVLGVLFLRGHTVVIEPRANLVEVDGTVESLISRQEVVRLQAQMDVREMEKILDKDRTRQEDELGIDPSPTLTMNSLPLSDDSDNTLFSSSESDDPTIVADGLQLDLSSPSPQSSPSSLPPVIEEEPMLVVLGTINGFTALIGIDTSSPIDFLSPAFVSHSKLTPFSLPTPHYPHIPTSAHDVEITHGVHTIVSLAGRATWYYFDISPSPLQGGFDAIFGMPYLRRHGVRIDFSNKLLVQNERTAWGVSSETYQRHQAVLSASDTGSLGEVAFPNSQRVEVDIWEAMGPMKGRVGRAGADLRARCGPALGLYTSSTADVRRSSPEAEVWSRVASMDEEDGSGLDLELNSGYGSDRD